MTTLQSAVFQLCYNLENFIVKTINLDRMVGVEHLKLDHTFLS